MTEPTSENTFETNTVETNAVEHNPAEHNPAPPQHLAPQPLPIPWRRRAAVLTLGVALLGGGLAGGALLAGGTSTAPSAGSSATSQLPSMSSFSGRSGGGYGYFSGGGQSSQGEPGTGSGSSTTTETASDATAAQSSGLVEITSTLTTGIAAGTGIVLTSDGTVVTNHHVVAGATSVKVTVVSTGATYTARYVGGDSTADVAVLQLENASGLTTAKLAGNAAQVDDEVTAVGDAGGDGGSLTAAPGTVAALNQDINVQDDSGGSNSLTGLIAMNAYVVPGDSGGAVLNSSGEVVGMNVAASTGTGAVTGYAIPIAEVTSVANQILSGSTSSQITLGYSGFLGVGLDATSTKPLIAGVESGGAAAQAGIAAGDTITSVNGTSVTTSAKLRQLLAALPAGSRAEIGWTTASGARHSATVTLGQAPIA